MKKLLAIVLALALCLGMVTMATAETTKYKIGVLVPAVTHGWVGGITYNAEQYCKELEAAGTIEYKLLTSSNAEEMTAQFDEVILWGAQAIVVAPQWTGMEVAAQNAIDQGINRRGLRYGHPRRGHLQGDRRQREHGRCQRELHR